MVRVYRSVSALAFAAYLALGLGWSDAAGAAGYYSPPRSEVEMLRCWDRVFGRYGNLVRSMEQQPGRQGVRVRFNVRVPGNGERTLVCDGATGRIVNE
jgi:hypothetical protein